MLTTYAPSRTEVEPAPSIFDFPAITILPEAVPARRSAPTRFRPKRVPPERKLSALIRAGAKKAEGQTTGHFAYWTGSGVIVCAMGAAALAVRKRIPRDDGEAEILDDNWATGLNRRGVDYTAYVKHPLDGLERTVSDTVIDLNDSHRWTFEQIIDWLKSIGR